MAKISRREFLKTAALGLGGAALAACGTGKVEMPASQARPTHPPTAAQSSATRSPATAGPAQAAASPTGEPAATAASAAATPSPAVAAQVSNPELVVAHGSGSYQIEDLVRQVLAPLGGMGVFVKKGAKVIVKPNICVAYHSYEYAATSNPWVIGALVKLAFEAGAASVQVLDFPFGGTAKEAYQVSGIADQVKAAGGEMAFMPGFKYKVVEIPQGKDLSQIGIFTDILSADTVINVPIAKHHSLARLTLGMKNLMGVIQNREEMHIHMGERLADLAGLVKPTLTVVDAVRILMHNGPTGGNLKDVKQLDTLIASPDIVAADSYATTLFGMQPDDIEYIRAGAARGLGKSDLKSLRIAEVPVGG
ncbi:MAG TPA: DUF362 domain-containing protein [Anaerolineales bacterium]